VPITVDRNGEIPWPDVWERARGGSLFIAGAEHLSGSEQHWLLGRLLAEDGDSSQVRVLVSARTSLFERCRTGAFSETLFYRVNLVHLVPTDDGHAAMSA
jgi:DNA-binding NtrC family response regulator